MGGQPIPGNHAYDVWMRLNALPRVAIDLQFNARDEEFPAQCSLAFDPSVEAYLDSRSIFILGTYLTGRLIALRAPGEPAADQASRRSWTAKKAAAKRGIHNQKGAIPSDRKSDGSSIIA